MIDRNNIPSDWDALGDRQARMRPESSRPPESDTGGPEPSLITLMATSWADLVSILAVCTSALIAILILGERPTLPAFAWAAALAMVWWVFAASVLVVVRQGTPGMLLAGVNFATPVLPKRVPLVLAAALAGVATIGLPGLLGGQRSILGSAAASDVVADDSV
jgi:hypothetical protein